MLCQGFEPRVDIGTAWICFFFWYVRATTICRHLLASTHAACPKASSNQSYAQGTARRNIILPQQERAIFNDEDERTITCVTRLGNSFMESHVFTVRATPALVSLCKPDNGATNAPRMPISPEQRGIHPTPLSHQHC